MRDLLRCGNYIHHHSCIYSLVRMIQNCISYCYHISLCSSFYISNLLWYSFLTAVSLRILTNNLVKTEEVISNGCYDNCNYLVGVITEFAKFADDQFSVGMFSHLSVIIFLYHSEFVHW